jgi:hypothetical protein
LLFGPDVPKVDRISIGYLCISITTWNTRCQPPAQSSPGGTQH